MKRYLISILCTLCTLTLFAQAKAFYACDFEDDSQNAEWSLVNGPMASRIPNKWCIGTAVNNGGAKSLYISADNGQTATYVKSSSYVIAYTDITLRAGTYDLAFNWCAMGNTTDGIYVLWVPDYDSFGDSIKLNSNTSTLISSTLSPYAVEVSTDEENKLRGSATWKSCRTSVQTDGTHRRLAFVWLTSDNMDVANPGACIDNITIIDSHTCPSPTGFSVEADGKKIHLSWVGAANQYEVKCYSYVDKAWKTVIVQDTTEVVLTGVSEGLCDFYVSSMCDDDIKSIPAVISEFFLYYPSDHCIDYLTLDSTNCFIANEKVGNDMPVSKLTWSKGLVNKGYAAKESRHTIHYSQSETDPRTCGGLKTVPEGEIASVRLGNWNTGAEAERVEFKFHVDAENNPVLVLKYAVVLQKPGESCKPNPGFLLRVLDENGRLVSSCASADFDFKKAADAEWELCYPDGSTTEVRWKDWTTVGVDLSDFDDRTLTIQLTTYDCGGGGHYGYAYFTLGCSDGQLTGMSCGVENTVFTAPDGFVYQWYKASEPGVILGHRQTYQVDAQDTCHYKVDLMFAQDSSCYFTLTASAQPYQPYASATYKRNPHDCQNEVVFTSTSHIKETNQITGEVTHTNKPVDWVMWDFGDGTTSYESNPAHVFPNTGGPITVKLIAHLATCVDTLVITDTLPLIGPQSHTMYVQQCFGSDYEFAYMNQTGEMDTLRLTESGVYTCTTLTHIGCDSIITINLLMTDTIRTNIDTLIMRGETYTMGGKTYSETGVYTANLIAVSGCDSIVTLNLTVYDFLKVDADTFYVACYGDPNFTFTYRISQGSSEYYSLLMNNPAFESVTKGELPAVPSIDVTIPNTDAITPSVYKGQVTFMDSIGGDVIIPFTLELRYNSEVLTQRWNDVLAVRNEEYNGGYEFVGYQWYKDGLPIEGATQSYYYAPDGLDAKAEYAALITRGGDSLQLMTCAIVPQLISEMEVPNVPTLVEKGKRVPIIGRQASSVNGVARWTTVYGVVIDEQTIVAGEGIYAPHWAGMYLLTIQDENSRLTTHQVVVK